MANPEDHFHAWIEGETADSQAVDDQAMGEAECTELADLGILHAMIAHEQGRSHFRREQRIARVIGSLGETPSNARAGNWRRWLAVLAPIAAVLVVSFVLLWPTAGGPNEVLAQAKAAAQQNVDLVYAIDITRSPDHRPRFRPLDDTLEAKLHVGGPNRFVLELPGPLNSTVRFGSDGQAIWLVPAVGPALMNPEAVLPDAMSERLPLDLPFTDITSLLELLEKNYDIERLPDTVDDQGTDLAHIRGRLKPVGQDETDPANNAEVRPTIRPDRIDLWVDLRTGRVYRAVLARDQDRTVHRVQRLELRLISQDEKPDGWYRIDTHNAGRAVIEIPSPSQPLP